MHPGKMQLANGGVQLYLGVEKATCFKWLQNGDLLRRPEILFKKNKKQDLLSWTRPNQYLFAHVWGGGDCAQEVGQLPVPNTADICIYIYIAVVYTQTVSWLRGKTKETRKGQKGKGDIYIYIYTHTYILIRAMPSIQGGFCHKMTCWFGMALNHLTD